jgi:hypothetical protein
MNRISDTNQPREFLMEESRWVEQFVEKKRDVLVIVHVYELCEEFERRTIIKSRRL